MIRANKVASFTRSDKNLRELWQSGVEPRIAFQMKTNEEDKRDPIIKQMWRIIRKRDENMDYGYDHITYRILNQCE